MAKRRKAAPSGRRKASVRRRRASAPTTAFPGPPVPRSRAVWLDGPVPKGYWNRLENRRLYMRWLGRKLGFRKIEDWYRITTDAFKQHSGETLLNNYWGGSAVEAVKKCFPGYDWKEWLFVVAPIRFWHDRRNHRRYMKWLGQQLGIQRPSDWYGVTNRDFNEHKGGALLLHYDSTVSQAIMSYLPRYDWKEWLFDKTPKGFWETRANRKRYVTWLGKELRFRRMNDWYAVTGEDFDNNHGKELLRFYGASPVEVLKDCFPGHTWNEWIFARVPRGFWDKRANRRRYVRWLGRKLRIRKPEDWHKVRRQDFLDNYGGGLLVTRGSHFDVLKECVLEFR